jgi:hypothetical protein
MRRSLGLLEGYQGELAGAPAKASRLRTEAARALRTTTKYLAMTQPKSSCDLSDPGQPMTATPDHTHAAANDGGYALTHRTFT